MSSGLLSNPLCLRARELLLGISILPVFFAYTGWNRLAGRKNNSRPLESLLNRDTLFAELGDRVDDVFLRTFDEGWAAAVIKDYSNAYQIWNSLITAQYPKSVVVLNNTAYAASMLDYPDAPAVAKAYVQDAVTLLRYSGSFPKSLISDVTKVVAANYEDIMTLTRQ
jgi:hypothetical protein